MGKSFDFFDVHGDLNTFARQSDLHLQKFHLYVFSLVEGDDLTNQHLLMRKRQSYDQGER